MQVYLPISRPVLEYASPVWGGLSKGLSEELDPIAMLSDNRTLTSTLTKLRERCEEASIRTLTKTLFPTPTYSLRRHKTFVVPRSKAKRHELSFIPRALKLLYG